jgi:sporulation protein YlmC with PRC-barrel domain
MDASKLRDMAIVSMAEGSRLGRIEGLFFDPTTLRLQALQARGEQERFLVPLELVQTIGSDAVMVESSQATRAASRSGALGNLVELNDLKQLKVVDAGGGFVGTVEQIEVDPVSGALMRLGVHKGGILGMGGETRHFEVSAIRSVGKELITLTEVVETRQS